MTARQTLTCDEIRDLAPLFVTGALDPDEMDAVREHLAGCDDAHAELLELGEAATALLETVEPADPPAELKTRLLAAAAADLESGRHPSTAAPRGAMPQAPAPTTTSPSRPPATSATPPLDLAAERTRRRSRFAWVLAAAAVIVAVALGGWNIALNNELSSAQAYRSGVEQALDLAAQPGSVTALIRADDGSSSGFGVIGADGTVKLAMRGWRPPRARRSTPPGRSRRGRRRCPWATSASDRTGSPWPPRTRRRLAGAGDGHHARAERRQHGAGRVRWWRAA